MVRKRTGKVTSRSVRKSDSRKVSSKGSRKVSKRSSRSSRGSALSSSQRRLKDQQVVPWVRIRELGFSDPVVYDVPWEYRGLASAAKAVNVSGVGYVTDGVHRFLSDYVVKDYSWGSYCMGLARGDVSTPFPDGRFPDRYVLRDDQVEDSDMVLGARAAGAPEFLIANGTGTGKTVTTWSTVLRMCPESVLIVCPAAVIPVWRQHISDMGDRGVRVVVINYESLRRLVSPPDSAVGAKKTATQNSHIALYGELYDSFDVVVFDEAHKLRNPVSQQSRIADKLSSAADFVLRLTATPGKDPAQLHHLWRGLSWVTGDSVVVRDDKSFSVYQKWCARHGVKGIVEAPFGNGIKWDGVEQDLVNMEKILYHDNSDGVRLGIRRVPESWGKTVRQPIVVELSSEDRESYRKSVEDVRRIIVDGFAGGKMDMTRGLAAMVSLRQKTGLLKSRSIVDYAKYCIDDLGEQVVVTTVFHNTTDTISELLDDAGVDHVVVTGASSPDEKEENRLAFQRGEVPLIITSVTTGISLHAGEKSSGATMADRRMIVADLQWSPIEHTQLEGRVNRDGVNGVVTIPYLDDSMDEKVVSTLLSGLGSQSVLQGKGEENDLMMLAEVFGVEL